MASILGSEAKFATSCEVCAEDFSHEEGHVPKLLSCGHSFCDGCLTKLQKVTKEGRPHFIPSRNGVNMYERRIVYTYKYEIICPRCKEITVTGDPSSSLPKMYDYLNLIEEVSKSEKERENEQAKNFNCKEHPDYVLDMFCHNEEVTVCLYCTIYGDHRGHIVSRLLGFSDHQRTSIEYGINSVANIINDCRNLCNELQQRQEEITNKVEHIRKNIISKFDSVQSEIKRILDAKLESVLNQLNEASAVQLSCLENAKHSLSTQELEDMQTRAQSFLSEADECSIARERDLFVDMQAKIDEVQKLTICTQHMYDVKVDSGDHIVQGIADLVDSWVCCVKETKEVSMEDINTVIDRYSPSYGDSINMMFGEKLPYDQFTENPFARIDCNFWCDSVLAM